MGLLRQVPNRSRKLAIPITEELEQRLESVRRRCQEQHMELPFQNAFESFLAKLLDDAEAELSGTPPTPRRRPARPKPAARQEAAGNHPAPAPAPLPASNGQASPG
ncbi:MAG: hypothetical protein WAS21_08065 [Geminicoccaceae bacterium]